MKPGYILMIEARDATIAAQSAALAKAKEALEQLNIGIEMGWDLEGIVDMHLKPALAAIDTALAGRAEV